ncbi:MAG: hypothetical protein AAFO76_13640 [Cyanobacteria bacterium J06607_15]
MNRQDAQKWCQENNWTKLRLSQGKWVALPPGEFYEATLPPELQSASESRINPLLNLAQAFFLLITAALVAAIAIVISPFFGASAIARLKRSQSQGQPRK